MVTARARRPLGLLFAARSLLLPAALVPRGPRVPPLARLSRSSPFSGYPRGCAVDRPCFAPARRRITGRLGLRQACVSQITGSPEGQSPATHGSGRLDTFIDCCPSGVARTAMRKRYLPVCRLTWRRLSPTGTLPPGGPGPRTVEQGGQGLKSGPGGRCTSARTLMQGPRRQRRCRFRIQRTR